jgi:hypothetical protein
MQTLEPAAGTPFGAQLAASFHESVLAPRSQVFVALSHGPAFALDARNAPIPTEANTHNPKTNAKERRTRLMPTPS